MTTLSQASKQWATRPAEERFTSLPGMLAMLETQRAITRAAVVSSRKLRAVPLDDNQGLIIEGPNGHGYSPTHWSFGQAAQLTGAPAGYLRALPAPLAPIVSIMVFRLTGPPRISAFYFQTMGRRSSAQ